MRGSCLSGLWEQVNVHPVQRHSVWLTDFLKKNKYENTFNILNSPAYSFTRFTHVHTHNQRTSPHFQTTKACGHPRAMVLFWRAHTLDIFEFSLLYNTLCVYMWKYVGIIHAQLHNIHVMKIKNFKNVFISFYLRMNETEEKQWTVSICIYFWVIDHLDRKKNLRDFKQNFQVKDRSKR